MAEDPQITEDGLDALREKAARTGKVQDHGIVPAGSPFPKPASTSYYGNPVLKPPTWTWQVPLYFFVGGIAGISAVIALVAHLFGSVLSAGPLPPTMFHPTSTFASMSLEAMASTSV